MSSESLHLSRTIPASPANVWHTLTDLDQISEMLEGVTSVEVLTNGAYGIGTRWRETRKMMGMEGTEEMEVVDNDPLSRTVVEAVSGSTTYRTVFALESNAAQTVTTLTMDFSAASPEAQGFKKVVASTLGKLGMKVTAKAMTKDLEDIAAASIARR